MEYIYGAMLLHAAKKEINEENLTKVMQSTGIQVDSAKVKALVAALKEVNIDEAIAKAAVMPTVTTTTATTQAQPKAEVKEEKKTEEEAAAGLGALFG